MSWEDCFILFCLFSAALSQTVPCVVHSDRNSTAPRPRTVSQYPSMGPLSGQQGDPCFPSQERACNPTSCLYGFESNSTCSCRCFDPCATKRCNENEKCVVTSSPDSTFYGTCIVKPAVCPKLFCGLPECKFGYESDAKGCQTCDCKNPCLNFGCPANYTCQMLPSSNGTLMPSCVGCPKMDCPKAGVCPLGHAKNNDGCDVCECQGCPCTDECFTYCSDYAVDEKTGCDLCSCAMIDCEDKCAVDEKCVKKYTKYNRVYGMCERKVKCPDCSNVPCKYGHKLDSNGCNTKDCLCYNPCEGKCDKNEYCVMSADDCTNETDCRDAPMPICKECPSSSDCKLTSSQCSNGFAKDSNGCNLCQCLCPNASCPLYCTYGNVIDSVTGCELCTCKTSPCVDFTCKSNEVCKAVMNANGTHEPHCVAIKPIDPCQPINCGEKKCLVGFQKDSQGCILPNCTCYELCKNDTCPPGSVCKITRDDCLNGSECRDGPMPYCETITTTVPTTTTHHCSSVACEPGCTEYLSPVSRCPACNCTQVDPCKTHQCPQGQICVVSKISCPEGANCTGLPLCLSTTTTKTPIICTRPYCDRPCSVVSKPELPCPVCDCPADCENSLCPTNQTCQMVSHPNCFPPCPKIPKCVPSQHPSCFQALDEGVPCLDIPVLQYRFNSSLQTCEPFWYKGCLGNENRFSSEASCRSVCRLQSYACPSFQCSLDCRHGHKLDSLGCPKCECIDICEGFTCGSTSQQCRVQMTSCPVSSVGQTFKSSDGRIIPYCTPVEVPKCICSPTTCQVVCPFGKVKDFVGCNTCECFDPCASIRCPAGQLCQIVEYQNCESTSCSSAQLGLCMDAYAKRNIRMKINASFEVYVLGRLESLTREVVDRLSSKYQVKRDLVSITRLERGSILLTADVLYKNPENFRASNDQTNFDITLDNQSYSALILSFKDESSISTTKTPPQFLTHGEVILIILLCVLVPLAIIVSMVITYFICVRCKTTGRGSIKSILNTSSSDSLASHNKSKHEDVNVWGSTSSGGSVTKDPTKRPISFTEA